MLYLEQTHAMLHEMGFSFLVAPLFEGQSIVYHYDQAKTEV